MNYEETKLNELARYVAKAIEPTVGDGFAANVEHVLQGRETTDSLRTRGGAEIAIAALAALLAGAHLIIDLYLAKKQEIDQERLETELAKILARHARVTNDHRELMLEKFLKGASELKLTKDNTGAIEHKDE
jgi:hypothetical protein